MNAWLTASRPCPGLVDTLNDRIMRKAQIKTRYHSRRAGPMNGGGFLFYVILATKN
jgi:hypothetical protein